MATTTGASGPGSGPGSGSGAEPGPGSAGRSGLVAMVTGASSGIGALIARRAAADCGTVVLVARRAERLEELAREIEASRPGVRALAWPADLTDAAQRRGLAERAAAEGLAVDYLVNNAGFGFGGRFERMDADRLAAMVELNVAALQHLTRLFVPGMVERGRGGVLNVASTAAFQPLPWMASYAATKAFVLSFSEALWRELRGTGVAVTCLCPGRTATEFFDDARLERTAYSSTPKAAPEPVARAGWEGLKAGKRRVTPGLANKAGTAVALIPQRLVLAVTGRLFKP